MPLFFQWLQNKILHGLLLMWNSRWRKSSVFFQTFENIEKWSSLMKLFVKLNFLIDNSWNCFISHSCKLAKKQTVWTTLFYRHTVSTLVLNICDFCPFRDTTWKKKCQCILPQDTQINRLKETHKQTNNNKLLWSQEYYICWSQACLKGSKKMLMVIMFSDH